jgi:hypothetical protein
LIEIYKHYPKRNQNSKYGVINLSDNLNENLNPTHKYKDRKYVLDLRKGIYDNYKSTPSRPTQNDLSKTEDRKIIKTKKIISANAKIEKSKYLRNYFKTKFHQKPVEVSYLKYCDNKKQTKTTKLSFKRRSNKTKIEAKEGNKSMSKTEMNFIALAKDVKKYESQTVSKNHSKSPKELNIKNNNR